MSAEWKLITVDEQGALGSPDIHLTPGSKLHAITPDSDPRWLIIDAPGHLITHGRGSQSYQCAAFEVYEIVGIDASNPVPGRFVYEVEHALTIPKRMAQPETSREEQ